MEDELLDDGKVALASHAAKIEKDKAVYPFVKYWLPMLTYKTSKENKLFGVWRR